MASPQLENGYTRIANEILEHLQKTSISGLGFRIILHVIRKSYGFHKKNVEIKSLRRMAMELEADPRAVSKAFNLLIGMKVLVEISDGIYRLEKDHNGWGQKFSLEQEVGPKVPKSGAKSSQKWGQKFPRINKVVKERKKERKKTWSPPVSPPPADFENLNPIQRVVEAWKALNGIDQHDKNFNRHHYGQHARASKELLAKFDGNVSDAIDCLEWVWEDLHEKKGLTVFISTAVKHSWNFQKLRLENRGGRG